ncbi:MAG: DUF1840 domain-containing protein [Telluria sp.]|jgi:hypothetical protein
MLITFHSKAAADVMMYQEHAKRILDLLNKDADQGIITAAEAPRAVELLEKEIAESRLHPTSEQVKRDVEAHHGEQGDDVDHEEMEVVTFATRAFPLLDMLREARKGGHDVVWGV